MQSNKKSYILSNVDINIVAAIFISNIILSGLVTVILPKINGKLIKVNQFFFGLKELLYQFSFPLPTIPIVVALIIITLCSLPVFYIEKYEKEINIRILCGATKKDLFYFILAKYCLYICVTHLISIFILICKQKNHILVFVRVCSFLLIVEVLISLIILCYLTKCQFKVYKR